MNEKLRICIGILVTFSCSISLVFVEKSALATYISSKSIASVKTLKSNLNMNGKLVYYTGKLDLGNRIILDEEFGTGAVCARLVRVVEMYQWCERSKLDFGRGKDSHVVDKFESKHNARFLNSATHKLTWSGRHSREREKGVQHWLTFRPTVWSKRPRANVSRFFSISRRLKQN